MWYLPGRKSMPDGVKGYCAECGSTAVDDGDVAY